MRWEIQQGNLEKIYRKAVILLIGTNYAHSGDTAEAIAERIQAVVDKSEKGSRQQYPSAWIFPSGESSDSFPRMRALAANTIFQNIADGRTIRYLDTGNKFLDPDSTIPKRLCKTSCTSVHGIYIVGQDN